MKAIAYCIAFGCLNTNRDPSLTFFSLPRDIERRRKWLSLIDREDLSQREVLKKSSHLVCSAHFEESSFKIIKQLKENAFPSMFLHKKPQEGSSCPKTQSTSARDKDRDITLSNDKEYVTVETQTESLRSTEQQTQTSTSLTSLASLTGGTARKRKHTNDIRECKLKRRKVDQNVKKIKKELEAKKQPMKK